MWNRKHIFVYVVLKHVAHAKRKEMFVYLIPKRVFWVEKIAMYTSYSKACSMCGTKSDIIIAYLPRSKGCFPKSNRKQCNISLVLRSCNPSGMRNIIFLVLKLVWPPGEQREINISLSVLNHIQIASWNCQFHIKTIIIIIIALLNSSKRLFSLIYNVKYLKLNFPKIPLKNDVLFLL